MPCVTVLTVTMLVLSTSCRHSTCIFQPYQRAWSSLGIFLIANPAPFAVEPSHPSRMSYTYYRVEILVGRRHSNLYHFVDLFIRPGDASHILVHKTPRLSISNRPCMRNPKFSQMRREPLSVGTTVLVCFPWLFCPAHELLDRSLEIADTTAPYTGPPQLI